MDQISWIKDWLEQDRFYPEQGSSQQDLITSIQELTPNHKSGSGGRVQKVIKRPDLEPKWNKIWRIKERSIKKIKEQQLKQSLKIEPLIPTNHTENKHPIRALPRVCVNTDPTTAAERILFPSQETWVEQRDGSDQLD